MGRGGGGGAEHALRARNPHYDIFCGSLKNICNIYFYLVFILSLEIESKVGSYTGGRGTLHIAGETSRGKIKANNSYSCHCDCYCHIR